MTPEMNRPVNVDNEGELFWENRLGRRKFLKGVGALAGVAGAVPLISSCSSSGPAQSPVSKGGSIVYAQSESVENIDPAYDVLVYPSAEEVVMTVYDRLVALDQDNNLVPQLATSWEVSPDKLTWTFHLRKGVMFSDGTAFDANAVVQDAHRQENPLNTNPEWNTIYNKWHVVDPYTVAVTTEAPFSGLLYYMARYDAGMVSPKTPGKKVLDPVGCGPYKVSQFTPGTQVTVTGFKGYWGGAPPLDQITFRYVPDNTTALAMLQEGEAQVMDALDPSQAQSVISSDNIQLLKKLSARSFFVELNLTRPMFQDLRVRQALNYAVDKQAIVKTILDGYGYVMDSPASPTLPGYRSVGSYPYDPSKAKSLLTAAGWKPGPDGVLQKDGTRLTFNLTNGVGQFPQGDSVVQAVQAYLNQIGCQVTISNVPAASFFASLRVPPAQETFDTVLFGFNPSNGQMSYLIKDMWQTNSTSGAPDEWNVSRYSNKNVDRWLSQYNSSFSSTQQNELLANIQKAIYEDAPAIWLYTPYLLSAVSNSVSGAYIMPIVYTMTRSARLATS